MTRDGQGRLDLKHSKVLASWALVMASASAVASTIYQQLNAPLTGVHETTVTSSTSVVVVVIPGFPVESLILGILLGLTILVVSRNRARVRRQRKQI